MYKPDCDECDLIERVNNSVFNDSEAIELIEAGLAQLNYSTAYKYFGLKRKKIINLVKKMKKIKEVMK